MTKYLSNLNKEQADAVRHKTGPCMVLAGPGTGKTTVITARICHLLESKWADSDKILVVTFSKAAAAEMKKRFDKLYGKRHEVTFGTFHAVFFKLLKQYKGYTLENLLDESQKFQLVKNILKKMNTTLSEDEEQILDIINDMGLFMNTMADIDDFEPSSCRKEHFVQVIEGYCAAKEKLGKFDYDDMLLDFYYLIRNNERVLKAIRDKFQHILIDEFQDINPVQFEAIKLLAHPRNNLFVVGDDDQSIYGFRGATPDILLYFEKLYPTCEKVFLKQNYRTTKNILNTALAVINHNEKRFYKDLESTLENGSLPKLMIMEDFEEEGRIIAQKVKQYKSQGMDYARMAVIYRTNLQSRSIIDAFMDQNIPFIALDGIASIYNHWVFKDLLSYMALSRKSNEVKDWMRILNKPKRFISKLAMEKAYSMNGDFLFNLETYCGLNNLQVNAIAEMKSQVKRIVDMAPATAVRYIRNVIGYDEYLREYAYAKGINIKGLLEAVEEAESAAGNFSDLESFIQHVCEVDTTLRNEQSAKRHEDRVELLTMHRAKGLEFDIVFISGAVDGLTPYVREEEKIEQTALEEERRLFYVAMTRARRELYISSPKFRFRRLVKASRFINEMSGDHENVKKQFKVGQKIYHKIYLEGAISEISEKDGSWRIVAKFESGSKVLDLKLCLQNDLVRILEEIG